MPCEQPAHAQNTPLGDAHGQSFTLHTGSDSKYWLSNASKEILSLLSCLSRNLCFLLAYLYFRNRNLKYSVCKLMSYFINNSTFGLEIGKLKKIHCCTWQSYLRYWKIILKNTAKKFLDIAPTSRSVDTGTKSWRHPETQWTQSEHKHGGIFGRWSTDPWLCLKVKWNYVDFSSLN